MIWLRAFWMRLRNLSQREQLDCELNDELAGHLEMHIEDNLRSGMTPEEARRVALIKLGGIEQTKEIYRDRRGIPLLETFLQDARFGLRMLRKSPSFTSIAVLTLALGIGANTAIFSLVNAVLLRPPPYPEPQKVVSVGIDYGKSQYSSDVESVEYVYWRDHSQSLDSVSAVFGSFGGLNIVGDSGPVHVRGTRVTRQFFFAIGVQPMLGRGFAEDEDRPGGPKVAVLNYGLWRTAFGSDPNVIGRSVNLNGVPHTIVGVLPPGFRLISEVPAGSNPEVLIPLQLSPNPSDGGTNYTLIARLKPGITLAAAQADSERVAADFIRDYPSYLRDGHFFHSRVQPYQKAVLADVEIQPILLVLFGAVGFVLLIACVNVANLFLSRAAARRREIALRAALGATPARLFRQLLCESLLFAILAGVVGTALAAWGVNALTALSPVGLPGVEDLSFDWRVLLFTLGISVLVAIACGSTAAFYALRGDLNASLGEGSERSGSASGRKLSRVLVAAEVALSAVLLTGAGLLIATVVHLHQVPLGFDAKNLTSVRMSFTAEKYTRTVPVWNFQQQVISRVRQLPGVVSVATASATPLERGLNTVLFKKGSYSRDQHEMVGIEFRSISPEYFRTLEIPIHKGREFNSEDSADSAHVAVINESLAQQLWPAEDPLGKSLLVAEGPSEVNQPRLVVGVVADVKEMGLDRPARATAYVPQAQVLDGFNEMTNYWFSSSLLVRTAQPVHLDREIRDIVAAADPEEPVAQIDPMDAVIAHSIAQQRFLMTLMGIFAGLALILAAVGIYGVLSYQVARRTREMGIRMALGARPQDLLALVLNDGMRVVFVGVVLGLAAAVALSRFLESLLFGVHAADPVTLVAVTLILAAVAFAACYIPARRATRVDPIVALRYE
jgi:putative ABC transport system permease protein